ncbi:ABC transporter substrate-binding protein [Psychrobacter sp. I-STPA6b]|uniref:ABC transporter substrate-binding protein n=1 Tax=Psychrobacter sp. I-STPA6b TaxID=2585718 RepID=UPI001D0C488C|nr:ABC transporter substrate-binding protein [Psychrobacter sp. I-STPA6b]
MSQSYPSHHPCNEQKLMLIIIMLFIIISVTLTGCHANQSSNTSDTEQNNNNHAPLKNDTKKFRIFTPDWGIASELMAMGYPPVASGDVRVYKEWVGESLPEDTIDVGIRYQPNPEMMSQLDIDMVIDNYFYAHIRPMYGDVPVYTINIEPYSNKKKKSDNKADKNSSSNNNQASTPATWDKYADQVTQIGNIIEQPQLATTYLAQAKQDIIHSGDILRTRYPQVHKFAVVQFVNKGNLRMYAPESLFYPTLQMMGGELVSFGNSNKWGFAPIRLADLTKLDKDTCLLVIEPFSPMLQTELSHSIVWDDLNYGKERCFAVLSSIWTYGAGVSSMTNFAQQMQNITLQGVDSINDPIHHDNHVHNQIHSHLNNTNNDRGTL